MRNEHSGAGHRHVTHVTKISYPHTIQTRLYSAFLPVFFVALFFLVLKAFALFPTQPSVLFSSWHLDTAAVATFIRLTLGYVLAMAIAVPLALLANLNTFTERIFFPLFDITQSIPVLVFFPVLIVIFTKLHFTNGATIIIIALAMIWDIAFSVIGGLRVIPQNVIEVAELFHIRGFERLWRITLPAVFPHIITGSLLAWAEGWNIVIVAEVLHTYIPGGTASQDAFGLGSIMTNAIQTGNNTLFTASMTVMVIMIGIMNFLIWQKLLVYAEQFKFE